MDREPEIFYLTPADENRLEEAGSMLEEMYTYMEQHGLMIPLATEGKEKWLKSVRQSLGRFSCLVMAGSRGKHTGFAYGAIRFLPDYLGNAKVGVVTHIYVREGERGNGTGKKMLDMLESWFREKGVSSVELQVVSGNHEAMRFWEKNSFKNELTQYRKFL